MCIPCVPGVTPEWFDLGLRLVILGACPGQYGPLSRPCFGPGTHSFASSDDDDCRARLRWRWQVTACRQEMSGLVQDAARASIIGSATWPPSDPRKLSRSMPVEVETRGRSGHP